MRNFFHPKLRAVLNHILIFFSVVMATLLLNWVAGYVAIANSSFSDVAQEPLFQPHIQRLFEEHFLTGDTINGTPTGNFRPYSNINRAEFTKITTVTRLAELYGLREGWDDLSEIGSVEKIANEKLGPYYNCDEGACMSIGSRPFADVPEKQRNCFEDLDNPNPCEPWFGQYVYYAVSKGFIKGYPSLTSGTAREFRPIDNILRIHSLKMIMVDNGNIPPQSDSRYQRLDAKAKANNSYAPKCLQGAENYILDLNGGNTVDANKLLSYAILADRLDLFGANCEVFTGTSPKSRAEFLQLPLTRRETPRYFTLTMEYSPVEPDPKTDPTVNTPEENSITIAADPAYQPPVYEPTEIFNGDPTEALTDTLIQPVSPPTGMVEVTEEEFNDYQRKLSENKSNNLYQNQYSNSQTTPNSPTTTYVPAPGFLSIQDLATPGKVVRACTDTTMSNCINHTLTPRDTVQEESVFGDRVDKSSLWNETKIDGKKYYIPFEDLNNVYVPRANEPAVAIAPIKVIPLPNLPEDDFVFNPTGSENSLFPDLPYHDSTDDGLNSGLLGNAAANGNVPAEVNWAEPINVITGNFWSEKIDLNVPTRMGSAEIARTYNAQNLVQSPLGMGWSFKYNITLKSNRQNDLIITFGDGHTIYFSKDDTGAYKPMFGAGGELYLQGEIIGYLKKDGTRYEFNKKGALLSIKNRFGSALYFEMGEDGNIRTIQDDNETLFWITYNKQGLISKVKDLARRKVKYYYSDAGDLIKVKNPARGIYRYTYDENHRLLTVKNPLKKVMIQNKYDNRNRVVEQVDAVGGVSHLNYFEGKTVLVDPMGNITEHHFDENLRTTAVVDALGNRKSYEYGVSGNLVALTDKRGNKTRYEYDGAGNRIKEVDALGNEKAFAYNADHQLTHIQAKNGGVTEMKYDDAGHLTSRIGPLGQVTMYSYNEFGQKIRQEGPSGAVITWIYNPNGTVKEVTDAIGNKTEFAYNKARLFSRTTDALGGVTKFKYNKKGEAVKVKNALGKSAKVYYNKAGNKVKEKNENRQKTKFYYDDKNRLVEESDHYGNTTQFFYDLNDSLLKGVDAGGNETAYSYNSSGQLLSVKNAVGGIISYTYDENGNRTSVKDPNNDTTHFEYDALNQLVSTTDSLGGVTSFEYDVSGNLVETISPAGHGIVAAYNVLNQLISGNGPLGDQTHYTYSAAGKMLTMSDPLGRIIRFEYDLNGNKIRQWDSMENQTQFEYDALGRQAATTDANGNRSETQYDKLGRVISVIDALGNSTRFKYDNVGNRKMVINAQGNKNRFYFDKLNRLKKVKDAMGGKTKNKYDAIGNIIRITDPRGAKLVYEYDALGRIVRSENKAGLITEFTYDQNDNLIKTTSTDGENTRIISYEYDALGRTIATTDALGNTSKVEYDEAGNVAKEINALGTAVLNEFDANGRLVKATDAFGSEQKNTYDIIGNLIVATDLNGNERTFEYDSENRLISMIDPMENAIKYEYDAVDNRVATTDPLNKKIVQEFDVLGRLIKSTNESGSGKIFKYDSLGNKISKAQIASDGTVFNKITYTYNTLRRLTSATDTLGGTVSYKYDKNSNRTHIIDQNGNVTETEFDELNRPVKSTDALGNFESYNYDPFNNLIRHTDNNGVTESREYDVLSRLIKKQKGNLSIEQSYDALGNLTHLSDGVRSIDMAYSSIGLLSKVIDPDGETLYEYDPAGNVVARTDLTGITRYKYDSRNLVQQIAFTPKGGFKTDVFNFTFDGRGLNISTENPNGINTNRSYDGIGRLIEISTQNKGENILSTEYSYNDFNLKTKALTVTSNIPEATIEEYEYDAVGRLAAWKRDQKETRYEYDKAYNRIAVEAGGKKTVYRYNALNQLTDDGENTYEYDLNGNMIAISGSSSTELTWDPFGRMTQYRTNGANVEYIYDPLSRMITRNAETFKFAGLSSQFVRKSETDQTTTYLYDMNGSPLAWYNNGRPYVSLKNAHHDVIGNVDAAGNLIGKTDYKPFGEKMDLQDGKLSSDQPAGSQADESLGYQGQYTDEVSGLSHLNNRIYDPKTAQFLSPDPFPATLENPSTANRYTYSHNDPINFWDVTGLYTMDTHYYKTKEWAYEAAMNMGFSYEISRQLALNIASFDQYHDKEWTLSPGNYGNFDSGMNEGGQGNTLHFQNSNRNQMDFGAVQPQISPSGSNAEGLSTTYKVFENNNFIDPLNTKVVEATIVPIYNMRSLNEFNSKSGSKNLINNPRSIRDDKSIVGNQENITIQSGTLSQRLEQAIEEHDPRMFGIMMHEYQDHFAHAGFNKWHGPSTENDIYCEVRTGTGIDDPCDIAGINALIKELNSFYSIPSIFRPLNLEVRLAELNKKLSVRKALYQRDRIMEDGTKYWLNRFLTEQAKHYKEQLGKTVMYNKEEKMIHNVDDVFKITENFKDFDEIGLNTFVWQSIISGNSPCVEVIMGALNGEEDLESEKQGCNIYLNDAQNTIYR